MENFAIERLTALLAAGYVMREVTAPSDAIAVQHPHKSFKARQVFVYESGLVVAPTGKKDEVRIHPDSSQEEFYAFLRTVPKPSQWNRNVNVQAWAYYVGGFAAALEISRYLSGLFG